MNEVAHIHLGRQSYTIAADAHAALRSYLAAIKKEAGTDVAEEVELRMVELLTEQGITGDKVVLLADVDALKAQLGVPQDFKDDTPDDAEAESAEAASKAPAKRLFRDTQNGMVGGVAAGVGAFFGVDAWIVRILFIIATLAWGWGLLLYLAMWLLVPEAKTSSDRLQMQGKAVTVDSLKRAVENADVPGSAERFAHKVGPFLDSVFAVLLKVAGAMVVLTGLMLLFGLIAGGAYLVLHHWQVMTENFFPVGTTEHIALIVVLGWLALLAVLIVLLGTAMIRRKWPTAPWATGVLMGLLFVGLAMCLSFSADIAPKVRDRVQAASHTTTMSVASFSSVVATGDVPVDVEQGDTYRVAISYIGNADVSKVSVKNSGGTLTVDTTRVNDRPDCNMICVFPRYNMRITVYTPVAVKWDGSTAPVNDYPYPPALPVGQ